MKVVEIIPSVNSCGLEMPRPGGIYRGTRHNHDWPLHSDALGQYRRTLPYLTTGTFTAEIMPAATSEADIIFNKANVALAKSQRLIASWLPPRTAEELANAKSEEEIEKEEEEMFAPVPEL